MHPRCTVIVPTRNRPTQLDRCLRALLQSAHLSFEILVIDSAPTDEETQKIAERHHVRYSREPQLGASRARNRGVLEAAGEIVAFIDDDALPDRLWLESIERPFQDAKVMAVAGRTLAPTDDPEIVSLLALIQGEFGPTERVLDRNNEHWFEIAAFGGIGNGMNFAFRRSAFDLFPGFDPRIGPGTALAGGEDLDALLSLVELGYKLVYTPLAVVRHPTRYASRELRTRYLAECARSIAYFGFLLTEEPRHRLRIARYLLEALVGRRRTWRTPLEVERPHSNWKVAGARLWGLMLYARLRLENPEWTHRSQPLLRPGVDKSLPSLRPFVLPRTSPAREHEPPVPYVERAPVERAAGSGRR